MTYFYTLNPAGGLDRLQLPVNVNGRQLLHPSAEQAAMFDAYPIGKPMPAEPPQGKVAVPDGYVLDSGRWRQCWRYEDAPPPPSRVFSKLKIVSALMEKGVWADVKAALEGAGLYDLFVAAQDFREDHAMFSRGVGVLQSFLEWTDAEVEELLAACVLEG